MADPRVALGPPERIDSDAGTLDAPRNADSRRGHIQVDAGTLAAAHPPVSSRPGHVDVGVDTHDTASSADPRRGAIEVDAGLDGSLVGPRLAQDDDDFPVRGWDRYEFIARLGVGGMGTVYYARDPRLGRDVALKFIRGRDPRLKLRLVREARAQARIDHPNVCKVYEAGEIAGEAYIAMELIDGRPLGECGELSFHARLTIIRDVALALHEAHKLGILHRDIKPGNIMLAAPDDEGRARPVVMDFGIAHDREAGDALTQTGALLGTPAYVSPEQARSSHNLDRRSDVYSLGVTLYELLAGRPPFAADTPMQVLLAVLHDDPPSLAAVVPDVPGDVATIVHKCLHKHPGERYDSARALAEDLDRYIRGEPILARPEGWSGRLRRTVRRHRALVVIASLASIAVAVAAAWGLRQAAEAVAQGQRADERARAAHHQAEVALGRARQVRDAARVGAARQVAPDDPTTAAMILREVETRRPGELFGWLAVVPHLTRTEYFTRASLRGHTDIAPRSAWSPDGSRIAVASRDGTASVWRPDGERVATLTGHTSLVHTVAWSPDGARLVTASEDHTARVWLVDGTAQATLAGHTESVNAALWSPDGAHIVTASDDHTARVWRPDGALVATLAGHTSAVQLAAWRPDASLLVTGSPWDEAARIWRPDGALVATLHTRATGVRGVGWSPDGAHVLTASDATSAHVWRRDGALVTTLEHPAILIHALWSPDGDKILTTSRDTKVNVWQRGGEHIVTLTGLRAEPSAAAWSPDSRRVAVAAYDGAACVWSLQGRRLASLTGHHTEVRTIAWHPDGVQILTSADERAPRVWQPDPNAPVVLDDQVRVGRTIAWTRDGRHVALADATTPHVWRSDGGLHATLTGHTDQVVAIAWNPGDTLLLTASRDHTARVWREDGAALATLTSPAAVNAAAWSPDGQRIVTGDTDGGVRVWGQDGALLTTPAGHDGEVRTAVWSSDNQHFVTASWDQTARVWRQDGTLVATLSGHTGPLESAAWSHDGARIVTAASDRTARVWHREGALLATLAGHDAGVESAAWSPDDARIVTASQDTTARVWRPDGALLFTLDGALDGVHDVAWSQDGRLLAASSRDGTRIWQPDGTLVAAIPRGQSGTGAAWSPDDAHLLVTAGDSQILLVDPARITRNLWRAIPRCLGLDERTRLLGESRPDGEAGRDECEAALRCLAGTPDGDDACLDSFHARQSARTMNLD